MSRVRGDSILLYVGIAVSIGSYHTIGELWLTRLGQQRILSFFCVEAQMSWSLS
jgi:hypothetical protein